MTPSDYSVYAFCSVALMLAAIGLGFAVLWLIERSEGGVEEALGEAE